MCLPVGTESKPNNHPNEQWIFILERTVDAMVDGYPHRAGVESLVYIASNKVHGLKATPEKDANLFTAKDASFGLHGVKVG